MADKVFFDTNIIKNANGVEHFLGGRDQLERFRKIAEIMIPTIVITEIKNQKRKNLKEKRDNFIENPFFNFLKIERSLITDEKIEEVIDIMEAKEKIPFTKIPIKNREILPEIVELAVNNLPPFGEKADNGFKDTLIYFSILQYAEDNLSDKIYFISNDERLRSAFKEHDRVRVFKSYDDFEKHQKDYFYKEYFLLKLREELRDETLARASISDIRLDRELNWVIDLILDSGDKEVLVDYNSKEILSVVEKGTKN